MPIFNFFHGGFNLERTERKSIHSHGGTFVKLDLSSDCSTKNYYFVLSGYLGNVSRGSLPALISLEEPVIPLCVWTIAFCIGTDFFVKVENRVLVRIGNFLLCIIKFFL